MSINYQLTESLKIIFKEESKFISHITSIIANIIEEN